MDQHTVVITDSDLPGNAAERVLREAGHNVVIAPSRNPDDIVRAAEGASALLVQWATISAETMDRLPGLRMISRLGIGYDMIDVEAATARGIAVANTPEYCIEEVASHTLAMLLSLLRGLPAYDSDVRAGTWSATQARPRAVRPSSTTVAVVGYGRIGALVARYCAAIGFRVLVSDPFVPAERIEQAGLTPATLEEALAQADALTLHVPLTSETRHLLNSATLGAMRPGSIVVNTCRGPLIDEPALATAVRSGHIGAAGLDVFAEEPLSGDSPLRGLDRVILTPHAAWYSPEALADLPVHGARNITEFLTGDGLPAVLNPGYVDAIPAVAS